MEMSADVSYALQQAREEFRLGQKGQAYYWAAQAARLAPGLEEPWLLLASVASPEAAAAYLLRALEINPGSRRAAEGLAWAEAREAGIRASRVGTAQSVQPLEELTQQVRIRTGDTSPVRVRPSSKASPRRKPFAAAAIPYVTVLFILCLGMAAVTAFGLASIVEFPEAQAARVIDPAQAALIADLKNMPTKLAAIPTATATPTSSPTIEPSPTPTQTPIPTATQPPPTEMAVPVVMPTFISLPKQQPPAQPAVDSSGASQASHKGRWIEVNLSQQMVYAHEGNNVVASFLASTGTASHPTVTGDFSVWIKLLADDMKGPGYYLKDVPYVMYFYKGYGLHGTYWHHNFGTPMSHGCVNLETSNAKWLFNWASVGTLVNVHY